MAGIPFSPWLREQEALCTGHGWGGVFKLMNIFLMMPPILPFEIHSLGLIAFLFRFLLNACLPGHLWSTGLYYLSLPGTCLPSISAAGCPEPGCSRVLVEGMSDWHIQGSESH